MEAESFLKCRISHLGPAFRGVPKDPALVCVCAFTVVRRDWLDTVDRVLQQVEGVLSK